MLPRLAPLALVVVAACGPDMTESRLVGQWERRKALPSESVGKIPDAKGALVPGVSEIALGVEKFEDNGRWSTLVEPWDLASVLPPSGLCAPVLARADRVGFTRLANPTLLEGGWKLRSETTKRIEIEIHDPRRQEPLRCTLGVLDDGSLAARQDDGEYHLVRVAPK